MAERHSLRRNARHCKRLAHPLVGAIPLLLCFDAVQSLAMLVSRQHLHVRNRVALVNDLSAQERLDSILQCDNACGLAELVLDHSQMRLLANKAVE